MTDSADEEDQERFAVPEGILLVDKPKGWTSFDVVAKIRGVLFREMKKQRLGQEDSEDQGKVAEKLPKRLKVGHTGTLDPLATGLLVLAVGKSTKKIQTLTKLDKIYEVDAIFGVTSETGDEEGEKTIRSDVKPPSKDQLDAALARYVGNIEQTPPKYSAIKIDGQRAYKLAREGKEVKLKPRPVTIHSISNVVYAWPKLSFTVHVSSGTYIRSLVEDIGEDLDVGAYMSDLRRTRVGRYSIVDSATVKDLPEYQDISRRLTEI